MSLVFVGQHANFHHQYFNIVDILIHYYKQTIWSLNPCATSYISKEQKEMEINNKKKKDESRVETDASESANDANNDHDKQINTE